MLALVIVAAIIVAWSAFSGPLDRRGVTSAIVFTIAGFVAGAYVLGVLDIAVESGAAERLTELALALLLFSDASRLDVHSLRKERGWPMRLLLIGLPLTLLAGMGTAVLVFPGMAIASAFLLSTMLCSTDAALGQKVVSDPSVPARVRQALDVESGLNDGLAVPFFLVALDLANAELKTGVTKAVIDNAVAQIGWGLVAGVAAGVAGGLLFRLARGRGWVGSEWRQILPMATALLAFAGAVTLGGSGFIAAFVGGMAFGRVGGEHGAATLFTEETGGLLAAMTWIGFGAVALAFALPHVTWQIVLYALLSLTVVRMVPVAVAMLRAGARRPTDRLHRLVRPARARVGGVRPARARAGRARAADPADDGGGHGRPQRDAARADVGAPRGAIPPLVRAARRGHAAGGRGRAGQHASPAPPVQRRRPRAAGPGRPA